MIKLRMAALCAAGAMVCATSAGAVVMVASYSGSTNGFSDTAGVFGFSYSSGSGVDRNLFWSATFVFDTSLDYQNDGTRESSRGTAATVTVDGYTLNMGGVGLAMRSYDYVAYVNTHSDGGYRLNLGYSFLSEPQPPIASLETEITLPANRYCINGAITGPGVFGSFCPSSVKFERAAIQPPPPLPTAVPEPATWAMMILGFGAAGSMIRRRKAVIA